MWSHTRRLVAQENKNVTGGQPTNITYLEAGAAPPPSPPEISALNNRGAIMPSSDCPPFSLAALDCGNSTGWCLQPNGDVSGFGVRYCFMRALGPLYRFYLFSDVSSP